MEYFWYILWPCGLFYGHLVYFMAILAHFVAIWDIFMIMWYIFSLFGMLYQEKSGNPGRHDR
jgi:hypothetical protein